MSPRCWDPRRTRGVPRGPPQDTDRDGPTRWGPREDAEASPDRISDPPRTRRGPQERDGRTDSGRTDRQMERGAGNGCGPERMEMDGRMGGWLDRRTDGRTDGWVGGRKDGWVDGRTDRWTDGGIGVQTGGWMDEWMYRWTYGWMDGWTDGRMPGKGAEALVGVNRRVDGQTE